MHLSHIITCPPPFPYVDGEKVGKGNVIDAHVKFLPRRPIPNLRMEGKAIDAAAKDDLT